MTDVSNDSSEKSLSSSAQKFQAALRAKGFTNTVVELAATTRTSAEAAEAIGCTVAQIAKSLIFKGKQSGKPILIIASGINRVDEKLVAGLVGEPIEKPDADYVREKTGYVIGGVAPIGHAVTPITLIDDDLRQFEVIWAAAGTPHAVFELTPDQLIRMTDGQVVHIKRASA